MMLNKYPDKITSIFEHYNSTQKEDNHDVDINENINFLNEALCKISKSLFFDREISYCSSGDIDKFNKIM